jgi:3-methylcrotonyl-CoA carboxylase alpha subunit
VWRRSAGFRVMGRRRPGKVWIDVSDEYGKASVVVQGHAGQLSVELDGSTVDFGLPGRARPGEAAAAAPLPEGGWRVLATRAGLSIGADATLTVETPRVSESAGQANQDLVAPLPGLISDIRVKVGDTVARGDTGLQIEAMKLIHTLSFAKDGVVTAVRCSVGDIVASGATLVEIEPVEEG